MTVKTIPPPVVESASKTVPSEPRLPQRILVVEDDADIRRLNAEVLMDAGYQVDTAEDGAVAWDALQFYSYDLLITDHNMPNVSGVDLLKKLRAARMILPVVLVSGTLPTEELNRHPWLQIEATLLKPYSLGELLAVVRNVLFMHMTYDVQTQIAPPPSWQWPPPPTGLRL